MRQPVRVPNVEEFISLREAINLHSPFGPRDYAMLTFMACTGLRVNELVALNVEHVAFQGVARKALHMTRDLTKFGKERLIELSNKARQAIVDILEFNELRGFSTMPESPLLVTRRHTRMGDYAVQRLVKDLRERSGQDVKVTPHSMRHFFACDTLRRGNSVDTLQVALGHRRLTTTQVYTHVTREALKQMAARQDDPTLGAW